MFLSNLSIKRPVFATVMMLSLLTLGVASYRRLAIDLYPSVEIPVITIVTVFPGASPDAVEREVSKRIEEAVNPIAGVRHVGSSSREGVSQIVVEFELEVSADQAAQDARTKIAAIRGDLPAGIQDPIIEKLDIGGLPVVSLAVRSPALSPRDITTLVEKTIRRRLENVSGVGKIDLVGAVNREVAIEIKPDRLDGLGVGVDEVMAGLRRENIDTPLGRLTRAANEAPMRVQGKARTVAELQAMVITTRAGRPIRLDELADVSDGIEERRSMAFVDGTPAVALDVLKKTGANGVGVADAIGREAAALAPELPAGTTIEVVRDGSTMIRELVADVQHTLIIGGLLTIFIVFIFLNSWRSTVITGLTLPISVISSFIVMNFAGMTLNVMTLMALSLAIGLLIDDAIVVRENIVRHLERGEDHFEAARQGTGEIGLAVLATTFSIIAVFVPVAFMKGVVGRFFFAFGITVAFAVLVSLFVPFTLDPMLSSRWVDPDIARTGRRNPIARLLDGFNHWFDRTADGYRTAIGWALAHRMTVVALALAAFVGGIATMGLLESEFFPQFDQGEFVASFKSAPDASIEETRGRLESVTAILRAFPEIARQYASIGAGDAGTVRDARIYIKLTDRDRRTRAQHEIERDLPARLLAVPGIIPSLGDAASLDNRKPLLVNLRGEDVAVLKQYSQQLKEALSEVPGVVDLESTLEHNTPEYRLIVDRERAADAGVDSGAVAGSVGPLVGGQVVTTFEDKITQPIFTWGQVGAALRAARVGFALAEGQLRRFHQAVAKDVATAFYDALVARDLAALAAADVAQKRRHADQTKRRRALGTATEYDVMAAEVALQNARPAAIRAEHTVRTAREQLRFLLAESTSDIEVAGTLATGVQSPPPLEPTLARAQRNRPEVGELASQRGIYAELVTMARAAGRPRIDLSSSLGKRNLALPSLSASGTSWNAAVVATVPLFDGFRTRGRIAQAQADLTRLSLDELKLRDAVALEVRVAINGVAEAGEIVTALTGTVALAERLVFLAEKGYELGVKTHLEVQDAQLNLQAARTSLARAQRDYRVAWVGLGWATGTLEAAPQP